MIKTKNFLAVIFFLISNNIFSQWVWINPLPTGENILCVDFINDNTGYIATYSFNILKTTDGGDSWNYITKLNLIWPNKLQFVNENTGFVSAKESNSGNKLYKTTDGGKNWFSTANTGEYIWSFDFPNANTGYLIVNGNENVLYKTTNGGLNWSNILTRRIQVVKFFDPQHGSIYGIDPSIPLFTTVNGGASWISTFPGTNVRNISYVNADLIYAVNGNVTTTTYRSSNAGSSWTFLSEVGSLPYDPLINFINETTGYLIDNVFFGNSFYGPLIRTTNGGINWNEFVQSGIKPTPVISYETNSFYSVGNTGKILKSSDNGVNWVSKNSSFIEKSRTLHFSNVNTGIIAGDDKVIKTTDGGNNWTDIMNLDSIKFSYIYSDNDEKFYAACSNGYFAKSVNSGNSWTFVNTESGLNFSRTYFVNDNLGFLWKYNSAYYRTSDGGSSWQQISSPIQHIRDFSFTDDLTGFAVGDFSNILYKSTDGGLSWFVFNSLLPFYSPINIIFQTGETAYISGKYAIGPTTYKFAIYKSTNQGATWTELVNRVISGYSDIFEFKSTKENIFFAQYPDAGLISTDNGNTWNNILSPYSNIYVKYFFADAMTGYAAGEAAIAKTTNGGTTFIKSDFSNIQKGFTLFQNYPNPFNPVTQLEFVISNREFVTLKVYNILGKEMKTLVNEHKSPGIYKVEFDGSNFTSGIYFYILTAGEFTDTKRMMLIK